MLSVEEEMAFEVQPEIARSGVTEGRVHFLPRVELFVEHLSIYHPELNERRLSFIQLLTLVCTHRARLHFEPPVRRIHDMG